MPDVAAILVRDGVLSRESAGKALAAARDGDVASAALRLGLATEGAIVKALARAFGNPGIDLSRSAIPVANLEVLAPTFCSKRRIVPVTVGGAEVVLAMAAPNDRQTLNEIEYFTGRRILPYVAVGEAILRALEGLERARATGAPGWSGVGAPRLPDPKASWVGVVKPAAAGPVGLDLPQVEPDSMVLVGIAEQAADAGVTRPAAPALPHSTASSVARPAPTSPPGQGVRPAGDGAPVQPPDARAAAEQFGAGKVALVAEDDVEVRTLIATLLERHGCSVMVASNGRSALEMAHRVQPDLLVLDAMMPELHGFEVCRAVKADPKLRRTYVILCSAVYRGAAGIDAKAAFGADAFLEKPFRIDDAARAFRTGLAGGDPASSPEASARRQRAEADWRAGAEALKEGRMEQAVELCRRATQTDPLNPEAQYVLAFALMRQGLLFEAVAAFERTAELRPGVEVVQRDLALIYERLGFQRSARQAWAAAVEACTDPQRKQQMRERLIALL
jgi:CheY-like chemotaxis protein